MSQVLDPQEFRQVEEGLCLNMRQPVKAARYLIELLKTMNTAIARIAALEDEVAALKSASVATVAVAGKPQPVQAKGKSSPQAQATTETI